MHHIFSLIASSERRILREEKALPSVSGRETLLHGGNRCWVLTIFGRDSCKSSIWRCVASILVVLGGAILIFLVLDVIDMH